jgi:ribonuclease PH
MDLLSVLEFWRDPKVAGADGQRGLLAPKALSLKPICHLKRLPLDRTDNKGGPPMRPSKRAVDEMRSVSFERGVARYAEGSCLVRFGETHVLCAASLEDKPPPWLRGQGRGWVTAEYAMLPRATLTRTRRESSAGKVSGRSQEIQRLIGRSLRAVVDLPRLGERQITIDCDVLQADGGTRTASITGAWVALRDCLHWMAQRSILRESPLKDHVAAISCGIVGGEAVIDLDYAEDSTAHTDANFVLTGLGGLVEVQGSAEGAPFSEEELIRMLALARGGVKQLVAMQKAAVS